MYLKTYNSKNIVWESKVSIVFIGGYWVHLTRHFKKEMNSLQNSSQAEMKSIDSPEI